MQTATSLTTIDEVLTELQSIIRTSVTEKDSAGYFAALYFKVTEKVKEGIANNDFEDGKRMEKLDVAFAGRYIDALRQWKRNETPTKSWYIAFSATKNRRALVLQHLLLGINAHINLDLGIAASYAAGPGNLISIQKDFNAINAIIGSLIFEVTKDLNRVSPLISLFGLHATNKGSALIQFSVGNARDGAWVFAEELNVLPAGQSSALIEKRDQDISQLGRSILYVKGFMQLTRFIIRMFEWKNPAKIINVIFSHSNEVFSSTNRPSQ